MISQRINNLQLISIFDRITHRTKRIKIFVQSRIYCRNIFWTFVSRWETLETDESVNWGESVNEDGGIWRWRLRDFVKFDGSRYGRGKQFIKLFPGVSYLADTRRNKYVIYERRVRFFSAAHESSSLPVQFRHSIGLAGCSKFYRPIYVGSTPPSVALIQIR